MLKKLYEAFIRYQEKRIAYFQLNNLSDRELRDLGVSRTELWQKINGS